MQNFENVKSILLSRTVWSGVVTVIIGCLSIYNVYFTPEEQELMTTMLLSISTAVSGVLTIVFRYLSSKKLVIKTDAQTEIRTE